MIAGPPLSKKNGRERRLAKARRAGAHTQDTMPPPIVPKPENVITPIDVQMAVSLEEPVKPASKPPRKSAPRGVRKGALTKRGPPRPHKRLEDDVIASRIQKLTVRMDKAKAQHDEAKAFLLRYTYEQNWRLENLLKKGELLRDDLVLPAPAAIPEAKLE